MKRLYISDEVALPIEAATQTFLVVGKRGSGKTNTAARIVEQLLAAKVPVVILDPVDAWWGLKASRDGKGAGHSVYVFGGRHADLPLEAGAGALIADFLCEHQASMVLSCKHLSGMERSRFMVDFTMAVYRKWTRGVMHLVLEEAHELAPQAPPKGEKAEEMLGAFKRLWKLGRSTGIGGTAVTQRPASLHKDITTQSEILVVHRTIGPQDVAAVRQWIKYHDQGEEILPELASLKTGEAFVWAPEFPEDKPIGLVRTRVKVRETYDSASTPKHGEHRQEPKDLAPVDLERLRVKMAATIQKAKAEDPRELRKRIAELERELRERSSTKPAVTNEVTGKTPKRVEVPILKPADLKRLEAAITRLEKDGSGLAGIVAKVDAARDRLAQAQQVVVTELRNLRTNLTGALTRPQPTTQPVPARATAPTGAGVRPALTRAAAPAPQSSPSGAQGELSAYAVGLLKTVAARHPMKLRRLQVATLAKRKPKSSAFDLAMAQLVKAGLISADSDGLYALTAAGLGQVQALGGSEAPDTPEQLRAHWLRVLPGYETCLLETLIPVYPAGLSREEIAQQSGKSITSSAFDLALSNLLKNALAVREDGMYHASEDLF